MIRAAASFPMGAGVPRNRHHRALAHGLNYLMKVLKKCKKRIRFLGEKHSLAQAISAQAE